MRALTITKKGRVNQKQENPRTCHKNRLGGGKRTERSVMRTNIHRSRLLIPGKEVKMQSRFGKIETLPGKKSLLVVRREGDNNIVKNKKKKQQFPSGKSVQPGAFCGRKARSGAHRRGMSRQQGRSTQDQIERRFLFKSNTTRRKDRRILVQLESFNLHRVGKIIPDSVNDVPLRGR